MNFENFIDRAYVIYDDSPETEINAEYYPRLYCLTSRPVYMVELNALLVVEFFWDHKQSVLFFINFYQIHKRSKNVFLKKEKKVSYEYWVYLAQSKKYGNKLAEKAVKQYSDFTAS